MKFWFLGLSRKPYNIYGKLEKVTENIIKQLQLKKGKEYHG